MKSPLLSVTEQIIRILEKPYFPNNEMGKNPIVFMHLKTLQKVSHLKNLNKFSLFFITKCYF